MRTLRFILCVLLLLVGRSAGGAENLIFVTWDGFRWQEVFGGGRKNGF